MGRGGGGPNAREAATQVKHGTLQAATAAAMALSTGKSLLGTLRAVQALRA